MKEKLDELFSGARRRRKWSNSAHAGDKSKLDTSLDQTDRVEGAGPTSLNQVNGRSQAQQILDKMAELEDELSVVDLGPLNTSVYQLIEEVKSWADDTSERQVSVEQAKDALRMLDEALTLHFAKRR